MIKPESAMRATFDAALCRFTEHADTDFVGHLVRMRATKFNHGELTFDVESLDGKTIVENVPPKWLELTSPLEELARAVE